MKKIIVEFKTASEIRKLKTIMKNVYSSKSDHLPDINRFNLNKTFAPTLVDRAEIHITTASGTDVVTIAKNSLTFFTGDYPFTKANNNSDEEEKYIVLPWDLSNPVGQDNLKNMINRIKENTRNLKYIVFIRTNLGSSSDLSQSVTSLASLNLSNIVAEDNTEGLLNRIDELELKIKGLQDLLIKAEQEIIIQKELVISKQNEIIDLNNQNNLQKNQLSQYIDSRNGIFLETYQPDYKAYKLTNFSGKVTAGIGTNVTNDGTGLFGFRTVTTVNLQIAPTW